MIKVKRNLLLTFVFLLACLTLFSVQAKAAPSDNAQKVVNLAYQQLGKPYKYNTAGPDTFDCSGLVYYCYRTAIGVTLERSSYGQATQGKAVSIYSLEPGDLIFPYADNSHVGIYIGNNQVIYAPQTGDVVKIQPLVYTAHARRIEGWYLESGKYYFLKGGVYTSGWVYDNSKWYCFDSTYKYMLTGWQHLLWSGGASWFYFDTVNGNMLTGWQRLSWSGGTNWFYFDSANGNMLTGWQKLSWNGVTSWYYFDTTDGHMLTSTYVDGYYIDSSGASNRSL